MTRIINVVLAGLAFLFGILAILNIGILIKGPESLPWTLWAVCFWTMNAQTMMSLHEAYNRS